MSYRSWICAGLGLVLLSNICSVSIYWIYKCWTDQYRCQTEFRGIEATTKIAHRGPDLFIRVGICDKSKEMKALGIYLHYKFPPIAEFAPHLKYWQQQQPGAESCCPVELSRHRGEIRMEHGCYEDFNRGGSLFGVLRFGTDRSGDQHWQLVRDWCEEAPATLQELFKQKKRPRLHLHLQQQPSTSHVAKGEKCGAEGLQCQRRDAAAG